MTFNFGAFAGGLAKGGMDTYSTLSDIESQKKRDEMVALQTQQMKTEMQGKEALRSAIADQGGANSFTPNFNGTGGMDTNDVAPTPVQMSAAERRSAIEQRAIAGGADPEAAMRYTATRRTADLSDAFDTTMDKLHKESADRMSSIKATAESGGMKGLTEKFGPELKKAFGHDIQFKPVPGAAGEIVAMDGKKVVGRYSSLGDATQVLEGLVGQEFESKFTKAMMQPGMFGSAKELSDFAFKRQEVGIAERSVKVKEARLPYENMKDAGVASYYAGGKGGSGASAAGKATIAQQMVDDGAAPDLAAAYRIMASKDARSSVDQEWGKTRLEIVKANPGATAAELSKAKETFYAENGVAPQALADALTSGINPQTGKPFDPASADKLIADFNKKYPASKVDKADLTWVKSKDKTEATKPDSAIPAKGKGSSDFYSKDAAAARKAERTARDAAAAEEERKKREAADAESAKMRSAIAADFNSKYGR